MEIVKLSELIASWRTKKILWNLSAEMDFRDLLYTHTNILKKKNISRPPDVFIHTDFCRNVLEQLGLLEVYCKNFKYSEEEERMLRMDEDPYENRRYRRFPLFNSGALETDWNHFRKMKCNHIVIDHKKDNHIKTRLTLLSSRRILVDEDIYYKNSTKYTHFPELGLPELVVLELNFKIESDKLGTFERTVYYFFMENVNFLKNFIFQYKLSLSYIYYMVDGCSFGYNSLSNRFIIYFLQYLKTEVLILDRKYYGLDIDPGTYFSDRYIYYLFDDLIKADPSFLEIPRSDSNTLKLIKIGTSRNDEIIWIHPKPKRPPIVHTRC